MLTAHGSTDSHAVVLAEGKRNTSPRAGTPYGTVTWADIRSMADAPAAVPKERAQFFVPSSYAGCDGRTHAVQRDRGVFHGLAIDIDKGNHPVDVVLAAVSAVTGGAHALVYSSSSCTPDDMKWRVLLPLSVPVAGTDYPDTQLALFALLGQHGLSCDESLARCGQPIYLPNVPPKRRRPDGQPVFYCRHHVDGGVLTLSPDHPIVVTRESMRAQRAADAAAAAARAQEYQSQRLAHVVATGDDFDPIRHFNETHAVGELLNRYGFVRRDRGNGSHWKSPLSTSGSYSTEDRGDHWVTVSNWAAAHGVGRPTSSGFRCGDAFDLYAFFEHGGDKREAVRAYADEVRPRDEVAQVATDQPAAPRPTLSGAARTLGDWRDEVAVRRAAAVMQPGIHSDRSPTGAGKSRATAVALRGVSSSLTVLPTHTGVRENVATMRDVGVDAVAYPELTAETCQNYNEAHAVQGLGLMVGATVCPGCPFNRVANPRFPGTQDDGTPEPKMIPGPCHSADQYRGLVKIAESATHRVATHERLRRSTGLIDDAQVVVIDEAPEDVLAPSLTASVREIVPIETLARAVRDHWWSDAGGDQKSFAGAMLEVISAIHAACRVAESAGTGGTTPVALDVTHDVPDDWQRLLYRSIRKVGVGRDLSPDALSLVTKAATGELETLDIVTDETARGRLVHFVVGSWRTPVPPGISVVTTCATTDPTDLSVAIGKPVEDCTPDGHLAPLHPIVQLTDDISRGASAGSVAAVVEAFLRRHPDIRRLGIIGHQPHIRALIDGGSLSPDARARLAKWCYFGQGPDRGSNDWHETCDHLLILGTPRMNPGAYRRWLVLHGLHDAAGRKPVWGARPWQSETIDGVPMTIDGRGYLDADWHRAYLALAWAALWQAVGRARAVMPTGIPVTVVTSDPTPFPIAQPLEPSTAAVRAVVAAVRGLVTRPPVSELPAIENPYSQKFGNGVPTGAVVSAVVAATKTTDKPNGVGRRAVEKRLRDALADGLLVQPRRGWWALPLAVGDDAQVVDALPAKAHAESVIVSSEPYPQTTNVPKTSTGESLIVPVSAGSHRTGIVVTALPPIRKPDIMVVITDPAPSTGVRIDTAAPPQVAVPPDDVLMLIEERAAILEHDGGHQRDVADRLALEMVMGRDYPPPDAETTDVGVLPADVADIRARELPLVRDALRIFGGTVRLVGRTPDAESRQGRKVVPGQCRCGHVDRWVQVPIHGGRSVRVDCGHCDRFGWFGVWHGRRLPSPFDVVDQPTRPPPVPVATLVPQSAAALVG